MGDDIMGRKRIERNIGNYEERYGEPIAGILNSVSSLEEKMQGNQDDLLTVQRIRNYSVQLARATKMISDYTRLSNGLYRHKRQCFDLVRFVRGIARTAAPYALRNGVAFDYKLPPYPLFTITETEPLAIILSHLLSNACRFRTQNDLTCVGLYRRDKDALIVVWDRGPGIPDSAAPHIFEPYYSYCPDGEPFAGNGLGLTIAKQLAEFIGGDLNFGPNGSGTFFVLTLPLYIKKRPRLSRPQIPKETIKIIMSDTVLSIKESEENNPEMQENS